MRSAKELLIESKKFAQEQRWLSWWHLASTMVCFAFCISATLFDIWWPLRLAASVVTGLVLVRIFVLYHDYHHGAILRNSRIAKLWATVFGIFALTPSSIWKRSHDHHHNNNSKLFGVSIGSFPLMTTSSYRRAKFWDRVLYKIGRHPLTIMLGYLTVFLWGMCVRPFFINPKKHFDCLVSAIVHVTVLVLLAVFAPKIFLFTLLIPVAISGAVGSYLFYAQHNFPAARYSLREEWDYVKAALNSSSYIKMGRLMHWFTGNIGYHHVHHLNSKIPFYRLPEAMRNIVELQSPRITTLLPWDVFRCLRLKLWDEDAKRLVPFSYLRRPASMVN